MAIACIAECTDRNVSFICRSAAVKMCGTFGEGNWNPDADTEVKFANKLAILAGEVACVVIVMHKREGKTKFHRISDRPAKLATNGDH